jgi:hypothetical protein
MTFFACPGYDFFDRDDAEVVKAAFDRQVVVDDLGHDHLQQRQEEAFRRFAEPGVFHRRFADDGGGVDRIAAARDAVHVEGWIVIRQAVDAGVVAEGAFDAQVIVVDVAFEDELGVGRYLQIDRLGAHHANGSAAQEAGQRHLVDDRRQRRGRRVGDGGIGADRDRDRDAAAPLRGVGAPCLWRCQCMPVVLES